MPLHLIRNTDTADAERYVDALPIRYRETESAVVASPRTFPACVGNCSQGRRPCTSPEACHTGQITPAEAATDIGAETPTMPRKPTPQDIGNAAGTIVGGVVVLLLFMGTAAYFFGDWIALAARWGASFL